MMQWSGRSRAGVLQSGVARIAGGVALALSGVVAGALLQACGDSNETGGERVVLHTRVTVEEAAKKRFTSASGWDITLTRAAVAAGPFYYFDGVPPIAVRREAQSSEYAAGLLGLGVAHAHPGHYQAGNALGQMLGTAVVELFDGAAELPDGEGVTGRYRSARFGLDGASNDDLEGHVAVATGKAERDAEVRYFRAVADLGDVERSVANGHVEGCAFDEVDVERDGTVTVTVDPRVWFELADFTEAEAGAEDAPALLPEDSQPALAFAIGVSQLSAYRFQFSSP